MSVIQGNFDELREHNQQATTHAHQDFDRIGGVYRDANTAADAYFHGVDSQELTEQQGLLCKAGTENVDVQQRLIGKFGNGIDNMQDAVIRNAARFGNIGI